MTSWEAEISGYIGYLRAGNRSVETQKMRAYQLGRVARDVQVPPAQVTGQQLLDWMASRQAMWKPNTQRGYRGTLRTFYRWMVETGRIDVSPAADLPPVEVPRGRPRPAPESVFRFALRMADRRVRLAIMLGGSLGLRRGEIARSRREDLEEALVGYALRVKGKGGHVRIIPVPDELAREIARRDPGWLFPSPVTASHLTPHHLGKLVKRELEDHYTTHTLRHRFGTVTLQASGGQLRTVQELLGHASPDYTAIYTEVPFEVLRAAVEGAA